MDHNRGSKSNLGQTGTIFDKYQGHFCSTKRCLKDIPFSFGSIDFASQSGCVLESPE